MWVLDSAYYLPLERGLAWMSNWALSLVLGERAVRVSPNKGCRGGSIATL